MDSKPQRPHLERLLNAVAAMPPLKTAVVHPAGQAALLGVFEAAQDNLIEPILIGPRQRIEAAANSADLDISSFQLLETEHRHASAKLAVEMAVYGHVAAIMKSKIHTDKLMSAKIYTEFA